MPDQLGQYELRSELSRGTAVVFWRGWDPETAQEVVLLEPQIPRGIDEAALAEYATEFKWQGLGAARLSHPGIVKVLTSDIFDGRPAQVLEPIEGQTLRRRLEQGPLGPAAALQIAEALLEALAYAHSQGVMHGDINPDNVFLGESGQVKLAGFGIPYVGQDPVLTRSGAVMGTPGYLAPEQISEDPVDTRADLFAVAALAHEMLTGQNPFGASEGLPASKVMYNTVYHAPPEIPAAVAAGLPRDIRPALLVALAKEPKNRYLDAAGFLAALRGQVPVSAVAAAGLVAATPAAAAGATPRLPSQEPPAPARPSETQNVSTLSDTTLPDATLPDATSPDGALPQVPTTPTAAPVSASRRARASSSTGPGRRRKWLMPAAAAGAVIVCLAVVLTYAMAGGSGGEVQTTLPETTVAQSTTTLPPSSSTTVDTLSTTTVSLTTTTVPGKEIATVTLSDLTVTYNGQAHTVGVATDPEGLEVIVTYSQGGDPVAAPVDAGTYEVLATVDDETYQGSAVGILTINKADPIINVSGWSGTYTGTSHGATGTARGVQGEDLSSRLSLGASFTNVPGGRATWTYAGGPTTTAPAGAWR